MLVTFLYKFNKNNLPRHYHNFDNRIDYVTIPHNRHNCLLKIFTHFISKISIILTIISDQVL